MSRLPVFHDRREPERKHFGWLLRNWEDWVWAWPLLLVPLALAVALILGGCAPARSPADEAAEDKCMAIAFARSQVAVAERCDKPPFTACPEHDAIMAEWEAEARACLR